MCSANVFKSSWRKACISAVEKDNRFFLVDIDYLCRASKYRSITGSTRIDDLWNELKEMGYKCIGPSNAIKYPYLCININSKIFFSGYIGYETLGINFIGNKAISYDWFLKIHDIYNSHDNYLCVMSGGSDTKSCKTYSDENIKTIKYKDNEIVINYANRYTKYYLRENHNNQSFLFTDDGNVCLEIRKVFDITFEEYIEQVAYYLVKNHNYTKEEADKYSKEESEDYRVWYDEQLLPSAVAGIITCSLW